MHGPFDHDTTPYYAQHGAKGRLVCISRSQAGMAPAEADVAAVLYNSGLERFFANEVEPHVDGQLIRLDDE
ncbi:MAG TPA: hypothetical protein VHW04_11465 [Solirubrobacteraceae bacterium]|nr:hypothetical protein [Solirubrobacteraceae bacterium]